MNLRRITQDELEVILRRHKLWLANDPEGERADLTGANLYGANLYGANLAEAKLYGADLTGANLRLANLTEAKLYGAILRKADLTEANLYGADLTEANLYGADLTEAKLYGAILGKADLTGANLRVANLRGANLRGANLYGTDLTEVKNIAYPIACPEEGSLLRLRDGEKNEKQPHIYYAHHQWKYGSLVEKYELGLIKRYYPFATIFNPSTDLKTGAADGEVAVMAECLEAVRNSDILVFSSVSGCVGTGVYHEVKEAQRIGKTVYYIYQDKLCSDFTMTLRDDNPRSDRLYGCVKIDI